MQQRLWKRLAKLPNREQRQRLETLLTVGANRTLTPLEELRRSPTRHSAPALVLALRRLIQIRQLGIHTLNFGNLPPSRLKALARTALTHRVQMIARMADARRIAVLVAFAHTIEAIAQDDVLDVLELLVKELLTKSQRDGKQARLRTLKDLDTAALQLSQACRVLLESEVAPDKVREAVFERIDAEALAAAIKQVETFARPPEDQYYPEVLERCGSSPGGYSPRQTSLATSPHLSTALSQYHSV